MKIHIIGGSGTGKTHLANILCEKYNIPHHDLDNIFWDNSSHQYGVKTSIDRRTELLHEILEKKDWILEGVYYSWLEESFEQADIILVLDIPKYIYKGRIIRRFIKRKFGIEHGRKETMKSLIDLLKWTDKFQKTTLPEVYSTLTKYKAKTVILDSVQAISNYAK